MVADHVGNGNENGYQVLSVLKIFCGRNRKARWSNGLLWWPKGVGGEWGTGMCPISDKLYNILIVNLVQE